MQLHNLQQKTKRTEAKRVGRGGLRGKTSGRGHKGQKARAGNSTRPEMRDIIKKFPKRRGYGKNRARTVNDGVVKPTPVNLKTLEENFSNGDSVTPKTLVEKGVIRASGSRLPVVKILGTGDLSKKVSVSGCLVSESAQASIEKVGGSVSQ